MTQYTIYCIYMYEIDQWCQSLKNGIPPDEYLSHFLEEIQKKTNLNITYDHRIVQCLKFSFLHHTYSKFSVRHLLAISNDLYIAKFISFRAYAELRDIEGTCIEIKASHFIQKIKEKQRKGIQPEKRGELVNVLWSEIFPIQLNIFWQITRFSTICYPLLDDLWSIAQLSSEIDNKIVVGLHIEDIKKMPKKMVKMQERETSSSSNSLRIKIQERMAKEKQERKLIRVEQEDPRKLYNIQARNPALVRVSPPQKFFKAETRIPPAQVSPPKDYFKLEARNPFISEMRMIPPQKSGEEEHLEKIAVKNALFFNPAHRQLVNNLISFIENIKQSFCFDDEFQLDLFGSLRSRLALKDDFDIDLTYVSRFRSTVPKNEGLQILDKYQYCIRQMNLSWVRSMNVIRIPDPKMPPYLKIEVDSNQLFQMFSIESEKVDVTASNDTAIINSEFFSHFSKIREVGLLCILVKMWAKNRKVIKKISPMKGLSAYGVIMMCLFFLMETKQINFLQFSTEELNSITIGSLTPKISSLRLRGLAENFTDFLDYYRQHGRYHQSKPIICLLRDSREGRRYYQDNIVFNMYDFMDKTNPGRLRKEDSRPVLAEFGRAFLVMREGNLDSINTLFSK